MTNAHAGAAGVDRDGTTALNDAAGVITAIADIEISRRDGATTNIELIACRASECDLIGADSNS
jgi:hypothetical protein